MMNVPRRGLLAATALLGMGLVTGSPPVRAADWPLLRGNTQRSGVSEEKIIPPLSLLWRYTAAPQHNNPCAPAIVGDTAFFASGNTQNGGGVVYAVDVKTGAEKWRYPSQGGLGSQIFQTAPLVDGGNVYIGASDGNLYMLSAATGVLVRSFKAGRAIASSPVIYDNKGGTPILYFGSNDHILYAVDPASGNPVWRQPYTAKDNINSAPVIADNLIFVTSADQYVHAVSVATGIGKWQFRLPFSSLANGPMWADNTLYVPSGQRLHAFNPHSGNLRWMVDLPSDISVPPAGEGGVVYVISRDRKVYALRSNNKREVWEKPVELPYEAAAAPTISGDVLYIPTVRNLVYALSREEGRILWYYSIDPSTNQPNVTPSVYTAIAAPMAIANGTLYVLSDDGSLSAFRPDAPDTTPPLMDRFFPKPGSVVSGAPPLTFAAEVWDPGSGLDKDSVKMLLDDQVLDVTFDLSRDLVFYRTSNKTGAANPPLPDGRHTVSLTAKDWRGNLSEEKWSFLVDNTLPAATNRQQAAPTAPRGTASPGGRPTAPSAQPGAQPGARPRPGGTRPRGPGGFRRNRRIRVPDGPLASASRGQPDLCRRYRMPLYCPPADEFWACQRLAAAQLPPQRLRALLKAAASPLAALQVSRGDLREPRIGLTEKQAARVAEAARAEIPRAARERAETLGVSVVTCQDTAYPVNLLPLTDAPPLLFVRGALIPDDKISVAIVGSRRATPYGRLQAERFARAFAERGLVLVSGGAAGIDTAAHRGALSSGGRTLAVFGCGVDVTYPAENRALFAQIVERGGALVSEFPLLTPPEPWRFPTRNRIIAGIACITVLVETPRDSGALITARNAADYGRDVWVVPGPVDTGRSQGGHLLIQDGAALADTPEDVLASLGASPHVETASSPPPAGLSPDESRLLAQFDLASRHLDEAATISGLPAPQATAAATLLEMKGLVRRLPGNLYVRAL